MSSPQNTRARGKHAILIGKLRWKKRLTVVASNFFFFKRLLPQVNSVYIEVEVFKILFDI